MKGTFTFTDGASNQMNLTNISNLKAKANKFLFAKEFFRKVKQLFVQEEIIESITNTVLIEESINDASMHMTARKNAIVEATIPIINIKNELHSSHINYQLNIQQMNLFTYLKRAITSSEQSLNGQFLEQFKNFLSVIVGTVSDNNAPLGYVKRDFGILSNLDDSKLSSNKIFNQQAMRSWASVMFLTLFTAFGTLAQTSSPDVSVKKTINTQSPTIGQDVTYTIKVRNDGAIKATGVALTDVLPDGVTFKSAAVGGVGAVTNSTISGITTVVWNIGEVPATATDFTLTIVATVIKRGLFFNTAEITSEKEIDLDSTPNNHDINEDDQDAVCFSVAEYFYKGDEFTTVLPAGYTKVKWTKRVGATGTKDTVSTATPGVIILADGNLKITNITAYTEFEFFANNKNCPVSGCCPIKFIYGPIGSIGDFVFNDLNKDGIQNAGDTPLAGIKVILYKADGITKLDSSVTDINGKYLFDSLQTDNYKVRFILPVGSTFSPTGAGTVSTDSDPGIDGFSAVIPIDVEGTGKAKDNLDIDAGIIGNLGSIGDFVFIDSNGNNKQDVGETGLSGVTVELYDGTGTTKLQTVFTDANGKYLFPGLISGNYKVKFILPSGKTFVTPYIGPSAEDSDAGVGGFSGVINIDVTKPLGDIGRNNLTIDAGVKIDCNINVGTLATTMQDFCLPTGGSVVLNATVGTAPTVPTGFSVKYVLTKGSNLVIQQISNAPTFTVTATGEYRIHTLVYDGNSADGNFLDLSSIVLGTTKAADLISSIAQKSICATLDATGVKFNVNENPVAPSVSGATVCAGSTVTLGKNSLGITAKWYTSTTATFPFKIDSTISVNPAITTTYYISVTNAAGCESPRTPVTVTVNPKPENPVAKSSIANDCTKNLQTVNLSDAITAIPSGSIIEWHVANNSASTIISNTTTVGAGTYYAFAKSTAGCYSGGVSVTAVINPCTCQEPAIVSVPVIPSICGNTTSAVQLKAILGGSASSGTWTSNGSGSFDNATSLTAKYTPSVTDIITGSVEFTFTTNDPDGADPKCIAASAKNIVNFKAKPLPPTSLRCNQVVCLGDSNKLFSISQGNTVKWYASATSTIPLGTATDDGFMVTAAAEGTYTYYAEATTPEGCISERSSISFIIKKCLTDLAVIKKVYIPDALSTPDYLLGQTATYSIEAQNIGNADATDVKVNDILPVGATYVSSIPTGQYNSTTGIWSIGSLTKGSNKSLLIQVILGKTGSVVNTATISGTNEDLTKLANNTSTVTINVVDIANLSLTKTVSKSVVNIGDEIEYTITVLNSGPNTATNVEVKDKLPIGLTFVSSSTLIENAGVLTAMVGSIAKGATTVFTFKAKVVKVGKITNLAEVNKSDQKDPNSTPGNASTKPDEDDDDSVDINSTSNVV